MGLQQSKDGLLYEQVTYGNIPRIRELRTEGAGLEWTDKEGKTPLIVACISPALYDTAKTLIELGANVNSYCPGHFGGTPLHHAAKNGLEPTVKLLLQHEANALVMNDDYQTPLDIARAKGYGNIVRAIEGHVCLFSGWLQEINGPGFLERLAAQLLTRRVWAVVLPCASRNHRKPFRLELAMYSDAQDAQPRTIVPLWNANLEELNFDEADPAVIISDISRIPRRWKRRRGIKSSQEARNTRIKLIPVSENETLQLLRFSNACKGVHQVTDQVARISFPSGFPVPTAPPGAPSRSEIEERSMPANATFPPKQSPLRMDSSAGSLVINASTLEAPQSTSRSEFVTQTAAPSDNPAMVPSAPPAEENDGPIPNDRPIKYPSIDEVPVDISSISAGASSCSICLDAPVEGACIPCGHMVGCMMCLNEVSSKKWGCPVCRAPIDQVVRIYSA